MIELEKKLLLTKDEYEYLMACFGYDGSLVRKAIVKQINYYYDTDDLSMNRQNTTCRIRLKNGTYKGTMKQHLPNLEHSTESEMEIYDGLNSNAFTKMGLKLKGSLVTERCCIFKDTECEVVIDKNEYLAVTDYELEIEYFPGFEQRAEDIFKMITDYLVQLTSNSASCYAERATKTPSKSERFFERYSHVE